MSNRDRLGLFRRGSPQDQATGVDSARAGRSAGERPTGAFENPWGNAVKSRHESEFSVSGVAMLKYFKTTGPNTGPRRGA